MKRCETCNTLGGDNQTACYLDGQPLIEDQLATTLQEAIGAKYSLTKLIGKGAMGAVYGAHHRDLGDVAIKVMLGKGDNQTLSERFLREARSLRKLRHQNAVLIYDLDRSPNGVTYMVMEMIAGHSLGQDLRAGKRLELDELMEISEAVCSALTAAHQRGIIHRDLKPDNILRAEETGVDGRLLRTIKIVDFGIVKLRRLNDDEIQLTQSGKPIGTPFYMSPEQWFGDGPGIAALDHRTDIYALGCTLYELLSGRPPFVASTTGEMRHQHLLEEPTPLHTLAKQVPVPVSRVIMRALLKDRNQRQQSAMEFLDELRAAYYESFQHTDRKIDAQLRSPENDDEQSVKLEDTAESVPMFLEKVLAIDPALLPAEGSHEASPQLPSPDVAAEPQPAEAQRAAQAAVAPSYASMPVSVAEPDAPSVENNLQAAAPQAVERRPRRRLILIAATVLLLLGAIAVIGYGLYLYRNRTRPQASESVPPPQTQFKPPPIPMSALMGTLRVTAAPGSEVFVDDEAAGTVGPDGIFSTQAAVGQRNVRVAAKGYRLWYRDVRVKANQRAIAVAGRERPLEVEEATAEERRERALAAYDKKEYDAAEAEYRELLKTEPDDAAAHLRLGQILRQQQRYAEAILEFEAAARLDPKNIEARAALARLYLLKARDAEAEAAARQLIQLMPRDAASAHHLLARALLRSTDKLDEALSEIDVALEGKQSTEFLETKAYILLARGALDEALATARRALEVDPSKNTGARTAVAVILFRMERVSEAVSAYSQLRQADKNDSWGDIKRLALQRGYGQPALETLAALIARTN